jgi:hypothetical protein
MFQPSQGHLQGACKLHSLHIQCFCLLSYLVQFHCYIWYSYLQCLYLKYIKTQNIKFYILWLRIRNQNVSTIV